MPYQRKVGDYFFPGLLYWIIQITQKSYTFFLNYGGDNFEITAVESDA
jgi:hypothetical protein